MRQRLRERSEGEIHDEPRSNENWWEHRARTLATAGLIAFLKPDSVLDLGCGDGSLTFAAHRLHSIAKATFIDTHRPSIEHVIAQAKVEGIPASASVIDVEERLDIAIRNEEYWSVAVMTEFLEHVDNPVSLARKARLVAGHLVASSPLIEWPREDDNVEHLWAFDNEGYLAMLTEAGWSPRMCSNLMLHGGYYNFQTWVCERG